MKRVVKVLLGLVITVVVLLIAATALLPVIYDTDDLKRAIADRVQQQTGREFAIEGDLAFSVFPNLAVEAKALTLGNAPGFGPEPMARIGELRAGVQLLPLLRRDIRVGEVSLEGLDLSLAVDGAGQTNWGNVLRNAGTGGAAERRSTFSSQTIEGLSIDGGRVEYRDAQKGDHYVLGDLALDAGQLGGAGAVPFDLSLMLQDVAADSSTKLRLSGKATVDLARPALQLADTRLELGDGAIFVIAPGVDLDLAAETLQIAQFRIALAGLEGTGDLIARDVLGDLRHSGKISVAEFSPRDVMRRLAVQVPLTSDRQVLQSARLNASFSGSLTALTLNGLDLQLDDSRLSGRIDVPDVSAMVIRFDLVIDELNADRYLPPATAPADADADRPIAIPTDALTGQDLRGTLRIGKLRILGLETTDARTNLVLDDGILHLQPLTAGLYGGRYSGNVRIDASGAVPEISLNERLESIAFQPLAAALLGRGDLSGNASGQIRLTGRGQTAAEMLKSLDGNVALALVDGALEGIDVWYEIRRALALVRKQSVPSEPAEARTVFSNLNLDGSLVDGMLLVDDLQGQLPFLTFRGSGGIELLDRAVEIDLTAKVRETPELSQDPLVADLRGKSLPLTISGSLAAPKVRVDVKGLLKQAAADRLLDRLGAPADGEVDEMSDKERAAEALRGLLDRKKRKDEGGG